MTCYCYHTVIWFCINFNSMFVKPFSKQMTTCPTVHQNLLACIEDSSDEVWTRSHRLWFLIGAWCASVRAVLPAPLVGFTILLIILQLPTIGLYVTKLVTVATLLVFVGILGVCGGFTLSIFGFTPLCGFSRIFPLATGFTPFALTFLVG